MSCSLWGDTANNFADSSEVMLGRGLLRLSHFVLEELLFPGITPLFVLFVHPYIRSPHFPPAHHCLEACDVCSPFDTQPLF